MSAKITTRPFKVGDRVKVIEYNKTAIVKNVETVAGEVAISVNGFITPFKANQLRPISKNGNEGIPKPTIEPESPLPDRDEYTEPIFKPLSFKALMSLQPREWLIDKIIARHELGMLFGESGSGKSFVSIDLIVSALLAEKFAGQFTIPKPLNVAYCAGEGQSGLPARFATAAESRGLDNIPGLMVFTTVPQFFTENESIDQFVREFKGFRKPLDLLIIDTQHSATVNADENSSKDAGKILANARYAMQELDCSLIFIHHANKAKSGERGSSAFRGAMDVIMEVTQAGTKHILHCSKIKDGEKFDSQTFTLQLYGDSVCPVWDGPISPKTNQDRRNDIIKLLTEHPKTKLTAKAISEAIGISQSHANNILSQLVEAGQVTRVLRDENKKSSNRNPWVYFIH